jgi:hypothetical protein
MVWFGRKAMYGVAAGLFGLAAIATVTPAHAGFFDRLFGAVRSVVTAPTPRANVPFEDPLTSLAKAINPPPQQQAAAGGPSRGFCVRSCDGRFFPVQAHAGMSAAETCNAFCPASQTRLYSGANIDTAMAADGSRYASSSNAYLYRKQLVAGCTCNGRNAFGLAHIDAASDPTLRPGDIVATKTGLMAFTGNKNNSADFTPVGDYAHLSKNTRTQLANTRIMPAAPATPAASDVTSSITPISSNDRAPAYRPARVER